MAKVRNAVCPRIVTKGRATRTFLRLVFCVVVADEEAAASWDVRVDALFLPFSSALDGVLLLC